MPCGRAGRKGGWIRRNPHPAGRSRFHRCCLWADCICTIFARQEQRIRRIRHESGRAGGGNLLGGKDKRPVARSVPTKDTQIRRNGKQCAIRAGEQGGGIGGVKGIFRQQQGESAARSAGDKAASSWGKILRNYTRTTSDTSSSWCTTRTVSPAVMAGKGFSASK